MYYCLTLNLRLILKDIVHNEYSMEQQVVGPVMKGLVISIYQNKNGTYNGVIETDNKNHYNFFNNNALLDIDKRHCFNMATSNREGYDFEAINIMEIEGK